ncbi:MAG: hypothetical protein MJB14_20620, partial [Spirochaetes bacterium]|nr:hypothetical protein [Spirochaetota bacterium]
ILDRTFIYADPHLYQTKEGVIHPLKKLLPPYQLLLAVGGFPDLSIFEPLEKTLEIIEKKTHCLKNIGTLRRTTCMGFLLDEFRDLKKDQVMDALERAGMEAIKKQKISGKTKKAFEQPVFTNPIFISAGNIMIDRMQKEKKMLFERGL